MATEPSAQRAYRAACPNCGAPVEFRSAASPFAVCSFCRSTVVRDGDALRRIGQSAELFDDHSPLQLGAAGRYQGEPFTLVGRLQLRYADGTWNEWHALFDSGRSGWLSEDNGRYVFAFDAPAPADAPAAADALRPGQQLVLGGQAWTVGSVVGASVLAAQGELPVRPQLERGFAVIELRNPRDEVGSLDFAEPAGPRWSIGRPVAISELGMTGLAAAGGKTLKGRGVACPSCGNALEIQLSTTQSIACPQCHAVVDVSQGVGGELAHYAQGNGSEPQIPLGTTGTLAITPRGALPWQVVGYVERSEVPEDPEDEQVFWREYLLYHREEGFAFLVDAEDGWSWTAPVTGVPERAGDAVKYQGVLYRKLYDYTGRITYVLGEFYWKLERDQRTFNTDYLGTGAFSTKKLNRERTESGGAQEIVWSAGETLSAAGVLKAFGLAPEKADALRRDTSPISANAAGMLAKVFLWVFIIIVVLVMFRCDGDDCDDLRDRFGASSAEYRNCVASSRSSGWRTGGGSFGGYSSGGGHK